MCVLKDETIYTHTFNIKQGKYLYLLQECMFEFEVETISSTLCI